MEAVGPDLVLTHSNAGRYAALAALGIPVEGEQRLRMSYVRSVLGAPASWTQQPQAYLAFGETYADEPALARGLG